MAAQRCLCLSDCLLQHFETHDSPLHSPCTDGVTRDQVTAEQGAMPGAANLEQNAQQCVNACQHMQKAGNYK